MAKTYVYIPFPSQNIDDSAVVGGSKVGKTTIYSNLSIFDNDSKFIGQSRGHFIDKKSLLGATRGVRPLSVVKAKDVLEISAHGFGGEGGPTNSTQLGANVKIPSKGGGIKGRGVAAIKVEWLAQRISKDGLTKSILDIRLMVCYSGLEHGSTFGPLVHPGAPTAAADCLASLLAKALGDLGYANVIVSGATGEVMGDDVYLGGPATMKGDFTFGSRHFNSKGQRVTSKAWSVW